MKLRSGLTTKAVSQGLGRDQRKPKVKCTKLKKPPKSATRVRTKKTAASAKALPRENQDKRTPWHRRSRYYASEQDILAFIENDIPPHGSEDSYSDAGEKDKIYKKRRLAHDDYDLEIAMRWHGGGRDRNSSKSTLPSSKGPQPSEMIGISSNFEVEDTHSERGPSSRNNDTINYTGDIRQGHYHDSDLLMTGGLPRSSTESSNLDDSQQAYAEKIFEEDMDLPGFDS